MASPSWHQRILSDLPRALQRLSRLPEPWRYRIVSWALARQSRYFRTHGLRIVHIDPGRVSILVADHARLRNRAGAVHPMAAALAGEYAAALVAAQHTARGAHLVAKSVSADFRKPLQGHVCAQASLDAEQMAAIRAAAHGRLRIAMKAVDATGKAPVRGHVEVAWSSAPRGEPA
ncbi:DUF4442 domain-containing protein [Lysobacter enzymogenes]|uniref:DUF4442 domain-containing protein n=1 Tax=Lysobacter enzymogenes TaxID=69 RepID=UPI001A973C42|nr:DUF4442 domain-containing protein [Lysobacter enzymogenes]QQP96628.1 DUF4442 domain-containing protein [Lysobacter enzymogenes]